MTTRLRRNARALAAVAVGVGLACEPIVGDPGPAAPINSCPAHPCGAYGPPGATPSCNAGVCTVDATTTDLLLVIGLATDSYVAPGRTYLATLGSGPSSAPKVCAPPTCCALPTCSPPLPCTLLPFVQDQDSYLIDPAGALKAKWYLGPGNTALPVQATFRRRFGPLDSVAAPSMAPQDAADLGLPVDPVQAVNVTTTEGYGPNNTHPLEFRTYLPPGCYERTLQPFAPFSRAFPPEIKPWIPNQRDTVAKFDVTHEETLASGQTINFPTFDIARAEGLDGWTAYLRNIHTGRIFSNVVPLTGSLDQGVTLLTNHQTPPMVEALTDLELVVAPPAGTPLPTEVFVPAGTPPAQELAVPETYASLPTPVTMTGRIKTPAGTPVPAAVYFTAKDIADRSGKRFRNFEFVARVSTTIDPRTGAASYSALLPQGDYEIAVRPTDGSSAVTIVSRGVGGEGNVMTGEDIDVAPLVAVSGSAAVADERPLAEAVAEVLPTQCAPNAESAASTAPADSCLPRSAQTVTETNGSFALAVDPGQYLLRIRPRDGSRLPWKIQPIVVATTPLALGTVEIPAPISVGMQLTDSNNTPLVNAVVRVFTDPSPGTPAVELGQAITDGQGNYEMYLAPPTR